MKFFITENRTSRISISSDKIFLKFKKYSRAVERRADSSVCRRRVRRSVAAASWVRWHSGCWQTRRTVWQAYRSRTAVGNPCALNTTGPIDHTRTWWYWPTDVGTRELPSRTTGAARTPDWPSGRRWPVPCTWSSAWAARKPWAVRPRRPSVTRIPRPAARWPTGRTWQPCPCRSPWALESVPCDRPRRRTVCSTGPRKARCTTDGCSRPRLGTRVRRCAAAERQKCPLPCSLRRRPRTTTTTTTGTTWTPPRCGHGPWGPAARRSWSSSGCGPAPCLWPICWPPGSMAPRPSLSLPRRRTSTRHACTRHRKTTAFFDCCYTPSHGRCGARFICCAAPIEIPPLLITRARARKIL